MSVSVKISQLTEGGNIQSQDQIPVARGGETYKIPASQIVIGGQNVGAGQGQLFFNKSTGAGSTLQFRTLSGTEGITVGTQGQTLVISSSGQNPVKTKFFGDGNTTIYPVAGTVSVNSNNYRIDIDGVLQEPGSDYSINGSNIVFTEAPPLSSKVVIVSNNLIRAYDIIPSDGSVTSSKLATSVITGQTQLNDPLSGDDEFLIHDTSAAALRRVAWSALQPAGTVLQTVYQQVSNVITCSTRIPWDNSIPESDEGDEVITASITPTSATSKILIRAHIFCTSNTNAQGVMALFVNNTTNAIASHWFSPYWSYGDGRTMEFLHQPATTSNTTYKIRIGQDSGTIYVNSGQNGDPKLGGSCVSALILQEIKG